MHLDFIACFTPYKARRNLSNATTFAALPFAPLIYAVRMAENDEPMLKCWQPKQMDISSSHWMYQLKVDCLRDWQATTQHVSHKQLVKLLRGTFYHHGPNKDNDSFRFALKISNG